MSGLAARVLAAADGAVSDLRENGPRRLVGRLAPARAPATLAALRDRAGCWHLSALQGCDTGAGIEVCYHLSAEGGVVLTLVASLPRDAPRIPSVAAVMPSAALYEQETAEMLGVTFEGGPPPGRLLLPERWPPGEHPLRKDWKGPPEGAT